MEKNILGIECGSTRIKSILIDYSGKVLCQGSFLWENVLVDGLWSYSLDLALKGLQKSFADLKENYKKKFGKKMAAPVAIGISGMMHGYIALDKNDKLLVPFRTWRNTNTPQAAKELTELLNFNMPLRWSVSQYYQSVIDKLPHINDIAYMTTLAGYIHYMLTGKKVLGINDASGMFPVKNGKFDEERLKLFNSLLEKHNIFMPFESLLPTVLCAGENAGALTEKGALLLDPTGELPSNIPLCPPEGDMGTGIIATGCVKGGEANVSCGTSGNLTVILDKPLKNIYPEVDISATCDGAIVAVLHYNNCTSEINAWVNLFNQVLTLFGKNVSTGELYEKLFNVSLESDDNNLTVYNFTSSEPGVGALKPFLGVIRENSELNLSDFMQAQLFSAIAPLCFSMDILSEENVNITRIVGHGGYFKTDKVGQIALSSLLNAPVTIMPVSAEGGAFGIALLALYMLKNDAPLNDFLNGVFSGTKQSTYYATDEEKAKMENYIKLYKKRLKLVRK